MTIYNKIEQAIRLHKENLYVNDNVQESDVRHTIRWVMRDNPDIFWFVHQYHYDKTKKTIFFRYQFSIERSELIQKSIDDVVENDFQIGHVRTLSIYEQVTYVYKWLLIYCNYNVNSAYNQNIDSVFVRRNSVCTGYAKAAQYLFKLLGIESRLVFGRLNNDKENGRHCWNMVCIEGAYYHLDVCLGDPVLEDLLAKAGTIGVMRFGGFNYNCFCVSTEEISKTRSIEDIETLPICDKILNKESVESLSRIDINQRNDKTGCLLAHNGSTADIYLCSKDKNIVLKKFRGDDNSKCKEEYGYIALLRGCEHLIQLNDSHSDWNHNIIAIEQSTPIVSLFCSHNYHPTLNGMLMMIKDITLGWLECYQRGILYRDIHICNIYKTNDGKYKLGDFGSCTYELRIFGERVGNPWFMSPETYINGQFDERSAIYSITAVLYFVLNGLRPPFADDNNEEEAIQRKMKGETLPEPSLLKTFPKDLADVIINELFKRGCAFYSSERIRTCNELLHIIDGLLASLMGQRIVLSFVQQDTEVVLANKTVPDVFIPRDIHHKFAFGEEFERSAPMAAPTAAPAFFDIGNDGCSKKEANGDDLRDEIRDPLKDDVIVFGSIPISDDVEHCCLTMAADESTFSMQWKRLRETNTFCPHISSKKSLWDRLFGKKTYEAYSSIFAPAEVKARSHMLVQVYLHLYEETEKVKSLAQKSDKNAKQRDYIPLQCKLKKGDKVDVQLNIYGETMLMSDKKSVVWQGSFTKCSFDYFVPMDIDVNELSCLALLTVNEIPVGEMRFITSVVEQPRQLNPEIISHKYNKVFISYAHKDEAKVKSFHEGLKLAGIEHFFDRNYLTIGDIFPQVIQDYINTADLFVLFWSENASKSEYVKKERLQALERAFPQVKPQQAAKLSIYPMSIEPYAELPDDMKGKYHFGTI